MEFIHRVLALAQAVHVDCCEEIRRLVVAGQRRRFPHRAFGALAVSHQDIGIERNIVEPRRKRIAQCSRQSLAQRSGGHIDPWNARRGMSFENAVDFSQRCQLRHRENSRFRICRVKQGAAWPLERTNRSLAGLSGSVGSNCISRKNITETMSAADMQDVGCPEPASVVAVME